MKELVVLVDENDTQIGTMEKLLAHTSGKLHRAISVFIFNTKGDMLLQQRADGKYHSANLWSNACCSHPRPDEPVPDAAARRLYEEMGMVCELKENFSFIYKAAFANGLTEYEFDHVFTGVSDEIPKPNIEEVGAWAYLSKSDLTNDIHHHPGKYTEWFKICVAKYQANLFK